MKNLTNYSDQFILGLMEDCNANPHKATARMQYAVNKNKLTLVLTIWQDFSENRSCDDRCIFCEEIAFIDFCDDMKMSAWDVKYMMDFYSLSDNYLAECYEAEDEFEASNLDYQLECYQEAMWISQHC